jgi:hypothetical protein
MGRGHTILEVDRDGEDEWHDFSSREQKWKRKTYLSEGGQ